jgi:hypothetical protein
MKIDKQQNHNNVLSENLIAFLSNCAAGNSPWLRGNGLRAAPQRNSPVTRTLKKIKILAEDLCATGKEIKHPKNRLSGEEPAP